MSRVIKGCAGVVVFALAAVVASQAAAARDRKAPVIKHQAVTEAPKGRDLVIVAEIKDRSGLFEPTLYYRVKSGGAFSRSAFVVQKKNIYQAVIPAAELSGDVVEYFIESFDQQGNGPARMGGPEKPLKIKLIAPALTDPVQDPGSTSNSNPPDGSGQASMGSGDPDTAVVVTGVDQGPDKGSSDDDEADLTPWIIVGASTLAVVVVGGVVGGVLLWSAANEPPNPPGSVTLQVSAPPPYSAALQVAP